MVLMSVFLDGPLFLRGPFFLFFLFVFVSGICVFFFSLIAHVRKQTKNRCLKKIPPSPPGSRGCFGAFWAEMAGLGLGFPRGGGGNEKVCWGVTLQGNYLRIFGRRFGSRPFTREKVQGRQRWAEGPSFFGVTIVGWYVRGNSIRIIIGLIRFILFRSDIQDILFAGGVISREHMRVVLFAGWFFAGEESAAFCEVSCRQVFPCWSRNIFGVILRGAFIEWFCFRVNSSRSNVRFLKRALLDRFKVLSLVCLADLLHY